MAGLQDKVVIVTGAARGIGAATAAQVSAGGAKVVVTDILEEQGEKTAAELGGLFIRHDVTSESDWAQVIERVLGEHGRIDGLVNNAGYPSATLLEFETYETLEKAFHINVGGTFLGIKAVIAPMRDNGGGSIVNLSSAAGLTAMPGTGAYGAAKWGVRGLTKMGAVELGKDRIRVNSVHPGMVYTPMTEEYIKPGEGNFPVSPLTRVGEPEEIARTIAFLISDDASYISGAEVALDGGMTAGQTLLMSMGM